MLCFGFFQKVWLHRLDFDAASSRGLDLFENSMGPTNDMVIFHDADSKALVADCPSNAFTNEPYQDDRSDASFWHKRGEESCQNPSGSKKQQEENVDPDPPVPQDPHEDLCTEEYPTPVTCAGPEVSYPYLGYLLRHVGSCQAGKSLYHHFECDSTIEVLMKAFAPVFPGVKKKPIAHYCCKKFTNPVRNPFFSFEKS